jgi:hypothetical protein
MKKLILIIMSASVLFGCAGITSKTDEEINQMSLASLCMNSYGGGLFNDEDTISRVKDVLNWYLNDTERQAVSSSQTFIGMREELLHCTEDCHACAKVNETQTQYGVSKQFVYGDPLSGARYVYTRNGLVTAVQK